MNMNKILIFVLTITFIALANAQVEGEIKPPRPSLRAQLRLDQPSQTAADDERPPNTLTKGHITMKDDETGQTFADGDIKIIERWGSINVFQGSVFPCTPTNSMVDFGDFQVKGTPTYAALEFIPPKRWKVLDINFYIISELVPTGPLTTLSIAGKSTPPIEVQFNHKKSITRASVITVPKGNYILFGYKVVVPFEKGQVTFRLGKIIAYENCQVEKYVDL